MNPSTLSPGTGLQQFARRVYRPATPATSTPSAGSVSGARAGSVTGVAASRGSAVSGSRSRSFRITSVGPQLVRCPIATSRLSTSGWPSCPATHSRSSSRTSSIAAAKALGLHLAVQPLAPDLQVDVALVLFEILLDVRARGLGVDERSQSRVGCASSSVSDLDGVAVAQLVVQRHHAWSTRRRRSSVVTRAPATVVAQVGVDAIGEVQRRRPAGSSLRRPPE